MGVDYRKQYKPELLEPFWPNEILKFAVVVLCTLALIAFLAILPVLLDMLGMHGMVHEEQPANPQGATPVGIKPEWYFLSVYQHLRLMPTSLMGISGKTLGVISQGIGGAVLALLPFWYRRNAEKKASWFHKLLVTAGLISFLVLTIWGGWPEAHVDGKEQLAPFSEYFGHHRLLFVLMGLAIVGFYGLLAHEARVLKQSLK